MNNEGFWLFLLDNQELYRFWSEQMNNNSLYYAFYIEKCTREVSSEAREILHLRENAILVVDACLIPAFYRLRLKGYMFIFSETFFLSYKKMTLSKLLFFHSQPEGIIDMGYVNMQQKKCISELYREYYSPYDKFRTSILRNLLANLFLLSSEVNYEGQLKSGYLLNYALRFIELIDNYAFHEKKKNFYADKIGITTTTLDKSLQYIYHKTFKKIVANKNVIEAMKLLVFSDKSITQIAHELDYDVSNFIKFFSRLKGMHPKTFRESCRKIINEIENGY